MQVKNRTEEMTRGSVQKSVVVLSRLPLYGQIQAVFSLPDCHFSGSDFFVFASGLSFPDAAFPKVLEKRMQFRIQHLRKLLFRTF
jgi:hypothetical protein